MPSSAAIETADGRVQGRREGGVLRWRSIPYAAPPVANLRWRAPQSVTPWQNTLDATRFRNASCQPPWGAGLGVGKFQPLSEDCLTLNVVAPADSSERPRPVMVFVHGGGYLVGTSALELYNGIRLAEHGDIVFVSMNYRLGPLGYLDLSTFSTPERPIESNLGLRDQVAALQWVQRNIAAFGGDPDNVTIFGESAGGNAVTSLLVTPAARGLFHRAIAQSSPAHWAHDKDDSARWAESYIELLGATTSSARTALERATPKELGAAMMALYRRVADEIPGHFPLEPVIDGDYFPTWPVEAFRAGTAHRVPLIIGTNRRESSLFARIPDALPTRPSMIADMFRVTDPDVQDRVLAAYPGYPNRKAALAIGSDVTFFHPSVDVAQAHSAHAPTYMYRFDFATRLLNRAGLGATHAMELVPLFGAQDGVFGRATTLLGGRSALRSVSRNMQGNWLAFARTGEPLPSWPSYTIPERRTLLIDDPPRVVHDPHRPQRLAWEGYEGFYRRSASA
ncbi:carboxylesterase/lipase family protein [Antrihabitans sp. YC2-6]|uniref:carboxylesterase/lipase family protein n=1 Tax=Antrihabitans sp. YC2-6 TaxID=2799498 RepID=UPI0018F27F54|nr:carboxylesterase/lipase family protein [Antrihabitans sp. YC2-6]MBJ8348307.1 carboxylesterase/lipase family protein [Antrihabitans sp. YC2-6]